MANACKLLWVLMSYTVSVVVHLYLGLLENTLGLLENTLTGIEDFLYIATPIGRPFLLLDDGP